MNEMTPLQASLTAYLNKNMARMHTPGHKGRGEGVFSDIAPFDVTEVRGTDSLFHPTGPILETEARYTALYQSAGTLLSAGGSTLCIQAMLTLIQPLGKRVLIGRNVHASAVNAMALLGLEPVWLYPDVACGEGLPGLVSPEAVQAALSQNQEVAGVYLTSPDYFGMLLDVKEISNMCHLSGKVLLIDNAHGAHLPFGDENLHPIHLGADLCCDSLHKTLPVLTGGALLQVGNSQFLPQARRAMALFGSTSPSYLIMLSMDRALSFLEGEGRAELQKTGLVVDWLRRLGANKGYHIPKGPCDPTRLTLGYAAMGYSQKAFEELLNRHRIEPEYLSSTHCVLLFSPNTSDDEIDRVMRLIDDSEAGPPIHHPTACPRAKRACSLRQALLGSRVTVPLEEAVGRVAAETVSFCPPGIPLLVPGEEISLELKNSLKICGLEQVTVIQ